jgi:glycosyltransferase involved in cell wall biosynthesis
MPELVENGKSGFLVNNVDEAIETVARIKEIDRATCRRHVERHFTVDRMVNEYIQVYKMILDSEKLQNGHEKSETDSRYRGTKILK